MEVPFEEQVRNYFLPKLGVSDEAKEDIRFYADLLIKIVVQPNPKEVAEAKENFEALRTRVFDRFLAIPRDTGGISVTIPTIEFHRAEKFFIFYFDKNDPRSRQQPPFAIKKDSSPAIKESIIPIIREFFTKYKFFRFTNGLHSILLKRRDGQGPDVARPIYDTLDSNGDTFANSLVISMVNGMTTPDYNYITKNIFRDIGHIELSVDRPCPKIQSEFPTCLFWSFLFFLYFDLTPGEVIGKVAQLVVDNGFPGDELHINAGLLAIFKKLSTERKFLTLEEVEAGHRETGLGKCRKCGLKKKHKSG